jgi:hypothetical protein
MKKIKKTLVIIRNYLIYLWFALLAKVTYTKYKIDSNANFVISIASYPERAHLLPAVFESAARQTKSPRHMVLVLSVEEWPRKKLPKSLKKIKKRGVEIIWVENNTYSVKMLLPVITKFPNYGIITLGDDWIYKRFFIEKIISSNAVKNNHVAGPLGKVLYRKANKISMFFRERTPAGPQTPSQSLYLMGLGTYYPPKSLSKKMLNMDAVRRIIPGRGSDIWFWCAAIANDSTLTCLGQNIVEKHALPIPETKKTKPKDTPGIEEMDRRFQRAVDYFGIRDKLLTILPEKV